MELHDKASLTGLADEIAGRFGKSVPPPVTDALLKADATLNQFFTSKTTDETPTPENPEMKRTDGRPTGPFLIVPARNLRHGDIAYIHYEWVDVYVARPATSTPTQTVVFGAVRDSGDRLFHQTWVEPADALVIVKKRSK